VFHRTSLRTDELRGLANIPSSLLTLCRRATSRPPPFRPRSLPRAAAQRVLQPPLMLLRSFFALCLFLVATGFAPSASAQAPPPTVLPPAPSTPAPDPTLDATLIIEVDPGGANVQLDGKPIEDGFSAKRLPVRAGHHVVEAHTAGRPAVRREVDVLAGGTTGIVLHVIPLSTDAIGYDEPEGEGPARTDRDPLRLPLLLAGAGVTLVALGVAAGFNLLAMSNSNDAVAQQVVIGQAGGTTSSCYAPTAGFARTCSALHDDLVARDRSSDVALGAYATAGVAAVATIAYAIWSIPPARHRRWTESLRPLPIVGSCTGGFAVAGVF
jgi:hypothetical protein